MLKDGNGKCWNDIKRRWEKCPNLNVNDGSPQGMGNWQPNPFSSCCLEAPCCLNCSRLDAFVSCLTNAAWNNSIWGWGNPFDINNITPGLVDFAGMTRSFYWSNCYMRPDSPVFNTLPKRLSFDSDLSQEACYSIQGHSNFYEDNPSLVLSPGDVAVSCLHFKGESAGCKDFSICWRYKIENLGNGIYVRRLAETRVCINDTSNVSGVPGNMNACQGCLPTQTPPSEPCNVALENGMSGGVSQSFTINLGNVSRELPAFSFWDFLIYFYHVHPECCTETLTDSNFITLFDNNILSDVVPTFSLPPVFVGNNPINVTFYNQNNSTGFTIVTVRLITANCGGWTLNILMNLV
jgi:hypothetical protein